MSPLSPHTPGPWSFGKRGRAYQHIDGGLRTDRAWWRFAKVVVVVEGKTCPRGEANARLILAAPELLDALSSLLDAVEDIRGFSINDYCPSEVAQARAAIAKATTQP